MSIIWSNSFAILLFLSLVVIFFFYFQVISRGEKPKTKELLPRSKQFDFDPEKSFQVVLYPCTPPRTFKQLIELIRRIPTLQVKQYMDSDFLLIEHHEKKKLYGVFLISNFNYEDETHGKFTSDTTFSSLALQINHVENFSLRSTAYLMFQLADSLSAEFGNGCMLYERPDKPILKRQKVDQLIDKTTTW